MRTHPLIIATFAAAALLVVGAGCGLDGRPLTNGAGARIEVTASFYPLAHFTSKVGGGLVHVTSITPAGSEPHEYEPSPRQIAEIHGSKLLVYNGAGMDNWAERLSPSLKAKGVATLEVAAGVGPLLPPADAEEEMVNDPHVWLDPVLAITQVGMIRDALAALDPAHAETYRTNAEAYAGELRTLDAAYRTGLSSCRLHTAVTAHASFAYLGRRYGFTQLPISGLSPDEEPSAGRLARIAEQAKALKVRYIFFETLVSPQLAKTIADEIGAQTLVFDPLEGLTDQDIASGKDYVSVMTENLANLKTALQCP
ncbi:MAG TPA: zinc ABC transporter substrate-binding protein [Candidatus Eisenbacteria bacterium]|nr:zinc ABC transporter substrate-binding protein [Candidatus Eisenbacteria bacterium]